MNGRLYDPVIGRFLQADPIIQAPHNAQSHNRYVYVLNNPLSFSDPSGFSFWTDFRRPILAIAAAVTMQYYLMPAILGAVGVAAGTTANFISAVASGFASGGIAGGNIQSALKGAFFAGLTLGLAEEFGLHGTAMGEWGPNFGKLGGQMALHTAMGCAQSAAAGGSCRSGAIAGGVSAFVSPFNTSAGPLKAVIQAVMGGIASRLSGGRFENGAITAAFSYLFNEVGENYKIGKEAEGIRGAALAEEGIRAFRQVAVTVIVEGKEVTAIMDFVYDRGGRVIIEEVKSGMYAGLSPNQKAVFQAAIEGGNVMITNTEVAKELGVLGEKLGARVGVSLIAPIGGRAAGELARTIAKGVLAGAAAVLSAGAQAATWSDGLADGTLRQRPVYSTPNENPRDRH